MSTDHMPSPPSTPTQPSGAPSPTAPGALPDEVEQTPPAEALPLHMDMARLLRSGADTLAQQLVFHSQLLVGVSAMAIDIVNARNTVLVLAGDLEGETAAHSIQALLHLATGQVAQVNDRTLPYNTNAQVAGLFQGLVLDLFNKEYANDSERAKEARRLLEPLFQVANEQTGLLPRQMILSQGPGPGPNARS